MRKRWLFFLIKILIACGILLILVRSIEYSKIFFAFRNPRNYFFIVIAFLLVVPNVYIQYYRWRFLLRLIQPNVSAFESLSSLLGGMTIGVITPGRIGEVGRTLFLKHIDRLRGVGLVFIDKLYSFVAIFIGGVWGLVFLVSHLFHFAPFIMWPLFAMALLTTLTGLIILSHPDWLRIFFYHISLILPYREKMKRLVSCLDAFQKENAIQLQVLSFIFYFIYILQFCLLAFAFQKIPLIAVLTSTTSTLLAKTLLPISFADLGIREGAAIYFFLQFQIEKVTAFNSSILLFAINVLIPTFIGFIFILKLSLKVNQNQHPS